ARDWAGDAYTVVRLSPERLALVWSIALRDAAAARVFKNLLEMQAPCWSDSSVIPEEGELLVGPGFEVAIEDNRLALVRGLAGPEAKAAAARALRFDATLPAPAPPLGAQEAKLAMDE